MKKNALYLLLVCSFGMILTGCGKSNNETSDSKKESTQSSESTKKVKKEKKDEKDEKEVTKDEENSANTPTISEEKGLAMWDVSYHAEYTEITGKTAPGAQIYMTSLSNPEQNGGLFTADANGNFTAMAPPAGLVRLVAYLNDEESEAFDIEIPAASGDFVISQIVYDIQNNTVTGKTEPNAQVIVTTPDNPEQNAGIFMADGNGNFTVISPHHERIRIIAYLGDKQSEPYNMTIGQ
ncbi:Ig-like domain-containing protein [Isobaculum melis]|uniref:Uncharacterized protein n=1 Tax=Isobaculum melis TaxID=142588 RepID=A0A1H9UFZ9_9LACT|nr:hypothetical protein [Isobaculum melis]SES08365.1 hypothetical protein SAMN04488559_12920 [Isobaculum melis]